jgi:hypothetical protein
MEIVEALELIGNMIEEWNNYTSMLHDCFIVLKEEEDTLVWEKNEKSGKLHSQVGIPLLSVKCL